MIWELVRKDLRMFVADRKAMITTVLVPIALASFMAAIYGGMNMGGGGGGGKMNAVPTALVDEDRSAISRGVAEELAKAGMVEPRAMSADEAATAVRTGKIGTAMILPAGFGAKASTAMFGDEQPKVRILYDPSKASEAQIVRGALMQSATQVVARESFAESNWSNVSRRSLQRIESSKMPAAERAALHDLFASLDKFHKRPTSGPAAGASAAATASSTRPAQMMGIGMPFALSEEPLSAARADDKGRSARRAAVVHAFVGMTVQGVLFFAIEAAMGLLRDRKRGIWRRFRAAPVHRVVLLVGRAASGTMIASMIIGAVLLFGALFFGLRVGGGSAIGFVLVCLGTALMAATFGLLVASLGKSEQQVRGFAILAVLLMVMLGGAWMPTFLMPKMLARVGMFFPTRWAVEGLDAMTWRGLGFADAIAPVGILLGFSAAFAAIAWAKFRWDVD
jgi:ABC-2 type transport system permease protein